MTKLNVGLRKNLCFLAVADELDKAGLKYKPFFGGKHPTLLIDVNGHVERYVIPGTSSDFRSHKNARALIRRKIKSWTRVQPRVSVDSDASVVQMSSAGMSLAEPACETSVLDSLLSSGSIRREGDLLCLTDLWKQAGAINGQQAHRWIAHTRKDPDAFVSKRGRIGGTYGTARDAEEYLAWLTDGARHNAMRDDKPADEPCVDERGTKYAIRRVEFRGASIETFDVVGVPHVALKPIVEGMGLDWKSQYARVKRDAVLSEGMVVTTIPSHGGPQETVAIQLKLLNGFLFGIDDSRVAKNLREGVIAYKRECYDALAAYWLEGAAFNPRYDHSTLSDEMVNGFGLVIDELSRAVSVVEGVAPAVLGYEKRNVVSRLDKMQSFQEERAVSARSRDKLLLDKMAELASDIRGLVEAIGSRPTVPPPCSTMADIYRITKIPDVHRSRRMSSLLSTSVRLWCSRNGCLFRPINLGGGIIYEYQTSAIPQWWEEEGRDLYEREAEVNKAPLLHLIEGGVS
jgi:hypothetical protein